MYPFVGRERTSNFAAGETIQSADSAGIPILGHDAQ
jgi:hypothetical protein